MQPMIVTDARPPYVRFMMESVEDRTASIVAGHFVGKDVVFAYITPQGSKDEVIRNADEWIAHIEIEANNGRFPQAWVRHFKEELKAFRSGQEAPLNGIPLKQWPSMTPSMERLFHDLNLHTVEDLAQMNEASMAAVGMSARNWKTRAQEYLNAIGPNQQAERMASLIAEIENLKTANAALGEQVKAIAEKA
jgi:hypothetical protein